MWLIYILFFSVSLFILILSPVSLFVRYVLAVGARYSRMHHSSWLYNPHHQGYVIFCPEVDAAAY